MVLEGQHAVLHIITLQGTDVPHAIPLPNSPVKSSPCVLPLSARSPSLPGDSLYGSQEATLLISSLCPFPFVRLCILSAVVQGSGDSFPNLANPILIEQRNALRSTTDTQPVPLASNPHRGPIGQPNRLP